MISIALFAVTLAISLPISAWIDYLIVRAVWRNVTGFVPPPKPVASAASPAIVRPIERPRDGTGTEFRQPNQRADELQTNVGPIVATTDDSADRAMRGPQPHRPSAAPSPRLSRCALFGAIWASYFFVALVFLIPMYLVVGYSSKSTPLMPAISNHSEDQMSPEAVRIADVGDTPVFDSPFAPIARINVSHDLFRYLTIFAAVVAGLIAAAAPFGTTILGFVAIGQIRRSDGKLYGLPLAAIDALLFPLVLLDFLIMVVVAAMVMMVLMLCGGPRGISGELMSALPTALTLLISLPIIAWADYRIARAAWRMIAGVQPPSQPAVATAIPGGGV